MTVAAKRDLTSSNGLRSLLVTVGPCVLLDGLHPGATSVWRTLPALEFHNADQIVPEWQHVQIGDVVRFAPEQDSLVVVQVEPEHCLVWRLLTPGTHDVGDLSKALSR